jgi:hypothetical protein
MIKKPKGIGGVPLTYTKEIGEEICRKIAVSDYGLKRLCAENPHWPCRQTILEWRIKIDEFGVMYAKAKQDQVETLIDDCLDIADDTSRDTIIKTNKDGDEYEVCNTEWINRSRLRIDTRKFLAQKLAPKIYGDKKEDNDLQMVNSKLDELKADLMQCKQPI